MNKRWIVNLLVIFLLASPATAEFYRYTDPHGNVIYTDDLSKVPPSQRSRAAMYEESESAAPPVPVELEKKEQKPSDPSTDEMAALDREAQRLLEIKAQLKKEYDQLAEENTRLKAEQEQAVTPEQIKEVNKKVVGFNARFQSYQEKSSALEAEVKAYNERLKAAESQKASPDGDNAP